MFPSGAYRIIPEIDYSEISGWSILSPSGPHHAWDIETGPRYARQGNRVYCNGIGDEWCLVGIVVQSVEDIHDLNRIQSDDPNPIALSVGEHQIESLRHIHEPDLVTSMHVAHDFYDLRFLEQFRHLQHLDLQNYGCDFDLAPLAQLQSLESLSLGLAGKDLSPLSSLNSLLHLNLYYSRAARLNGLTGVDKLISLTLPFHASAVTVRQAALAWPSLKQLSVGVGVDRADGFVEFQCLERLDLSQSRISELPFQRAFSHLRKLSFPDKMELTRSTWLKDLPHLDTLEISSFLVRDVLAELVPQQLRALRLGRGCVATDLKVALKEMSQLEALSIAGMEDVSELSVLPGLPRLERLCLRSLTNLRSLTGVERFPAIRRLHIFCCGRLTDVSAIKSLNSLDCLEINDCASLRDLGELGRLEKLEWISIVELPVQALDALVGLPALTTLKISECGQLEDVSALSSVPNLRYAELSVPHGKLWKAMSAGLSVLHFRSTGLSNVDELRSHTELRELDLSGSEPFTDLRPVSDLTKLRTLAIDSCQGVRDLVPTGTLSGLQKLVVGNPYQRVDTKALGQLVNLESLVAPGTIFESLEFLVRLARLRHLDLSACDLSCSLPSLKHLIDLRALNVGGAFVTDLSSISELEQLWELDVSVVDEFDIRNVRNLSQLRCLRASAAGMQSLDIVTGMNHLVVLELSNNELIDDLGPLANLKQLSRLDISNCDRIRRLTPLRLLPHLSELVISGCSMLDDREVVQFKEMGITVIE